MEAEYVSMILRCKYFSGKFNVKYWRKGCWDEPLEDNINEYNNVWDLFQHTEVVITRSTIDEPRVKTLCCQILLVLWRTWEK